MITYKSLIDYIKLLRVFDVNYFQKVIIIFTQKRFNFNGDDEGEIGRTEIAINFKKYLEYFNGNN